MDEPPKGQNRSADEQQGLKRDARQEHLARALKRNLQRRKQAANASETDA